MFKITNFFSIKLHNIIKDFYDERDYIIKEIYPSLKKKLLQEYGKTLIVGFDK